MKLGTYDDHFSKQHLGTTLRLDVDGHALNTAYMHVEPN